MHSKTESLLKRWHSFTINAEKCREKWNHKYWEDSHGDRVISCRKCPSFNNQKNTCNINFGTPLRKCVVSSIEAHFYDCKDMDVLEVGFGRFTLAKKLIQRSAGRWTGVDPKQPKSKTPVLGKPGYGHATHIPFPDKTFDKVFAIQSIEHWSQKVSAIREPSSYTDCISEIHRVLKPGGTIYLDAPIHFHGNELFIMGDIDKIRSLFPDGQWKNVNIERWREDYEPLERYTPSQNEFDDWGIEITSYSDEKVLKAKENGVVWLLVITAEKV